LCGIGGKTIAEAKENISYSELMQWIGYRQKRGSLHIGMRVEQSSAMIASLYANAHSKKGVTWKINDFMPHADQEPIELEDALKLWQ